jgi:MerR-like DNA binding protein
MAVVLPSQAGIGEEQVNGPSIHGECESPQLHKVRGAQPKDRASAMPIDEFARQVNSSARNVRAYLERGLLPPPRMVARTGLYDARLLDRSTHRYPRRTHRVR